MLDIYDRIGMSEEYSALVQKFANLVVGGQITTSGSSSAFSALTGSGSADSLWSTAWNLFFANADFSSYTGGSGGTERLRPTRATPATTTELLNAGDLQRRRQTDRSFGTRRTMDLIVLELNVFFDDGMGISTWGWTTSTSSTMTATF